MKNILTPFVKVLILLTTLSLLFIVIMIGLDKWHRYKEEALLERMSIAKSYSVIDNLGNTGIAQAELKTKLSDNKILLLLSLKSKKTTSFIQKNSFTIYLKDIDGFNIEELEVKPEYLTRTVDNAGKITGYVFESSTSKSETYIDFFMKSQRYDSITDWGLTWNDN